MTEEITFGDLIDRGILDVTDGYRAQNSELGGNGLIFLRAGHVTDSHIDFTGVDRFHHELTPRLKEKISQPGDVAVTTKGNSIGRVAFVTASMPPFVYSPHLSRWRSLDRDQLEPGFLRYWSSGREFAIQLRGMSASTDMAPYLSLRDQRRLKLTLPHIDSQRAIANVLGALDEKIEQNRQTAQALERLARAIFRAWFVDFEPVKAKAAGATAFPSMPQSVFDVLPTRFVDTDVGTIPEGWVPGRLGDLIEIHDSRRIPLSRREREARPGPYRYYGAAGIVDHVDEFLFDGVFVLVGEDGTVVGDGDRPMVQYVWGQFWVNNHAHVLTGANGYTTEHLRVLLDHVNIRPFVTGAVQPKLNQGNLKSVPAVLAPRLVIEEFGKAIASGFDTLRRIEDESRKLVEMRDYLLPKLQSGQIRVESARG